MKWDEFQIYFKSLASDFNSKGHSLFLVGGSVRDHIMGKEPKDFDFATSALPDKIKEILGINSLVSNIFPIGEKFGTIAAKLNNGQQIEITTFRKDISEGRHPEVVFTADLETDLGRRDFRFNSIAYTPNDKFVDPFNGQDDIKFGRISCTGNAFARLSEDPLRMLRAIRFVSKLGFGLEEETELAIKEFKNSILSVSKERWLDEMDKLLLGENVVRALDAGVKTGILWLIIPELFPVWQSSMGIEKRGVKDLWFHTKTVLTTVPNRIDLKWAALLHDVAKPQTMGTKDGKIHFLGHDTLGAEIITSIARRLKMSNDRRRTIRGLVFLHHRMSAVIEENKVSEKALRRIIKDCEERSCDIIDLTDLFGSDCSSSKESQRQLISKQRNMIMETLNRMKEEDLRPRLPSGIGNAIMEKFGLPPGPEVGIIRDKLNKMLLDGEISSTDSIEHMLGKLT